MSLQNGHDDYDPHLFRNVEFPMTNTEALISVLKCAIGTGCLAMPMAFYNAGWVNGLISSVVIGSILVYALHILLHAMYEMSKRHRIPILTYPEAMVLALRDGPPCLRVFSFMSGILVDFFLGLYHFGICCVYVVFIAESIKQIVDFYLYQIDIRLYMCMLIIPLMLMYCIRELKQLVPFSAAANVLLFIGFAAVLYYVFSALPPLDERHAFQKLDKYPLFFGTVLFALESVGVMIAIEANMLKPKDYLGFTGVMNLGMAVVITLYTLFGFFGYWRYGDDIEGSITLNIPETDVVPQIIKILFAIAIFFSYGLQGYIAVDVIWFHYMSKLVDEGKRRPIEYVIRMTIVLLSVVCAICFPTLGLFLSLVGASCLSILGLIFPSLMDICVNYGRGYGRLKFILTRDILIILFGTIGGIMGTYVSLSDLIGEYRKN